MSGGVDLRASFDEARLRAMGEANAAAFAAAEPFPHVVLDGFLDDDLAARLAAGFPATDDARWVRYQDHGRTEKLALADEGAMPPLFQQVLWALNSGVVIRFLEALTGIGGLVADPHLVGGGLHRIEAGGYLDVHADFNHHTVLKLDRRLNLLLYLNPDWDDAWGGHLELWDADHRCVQRVAPVLNRCVVFATTDDALHGHPEPLACPPERARCSLALYYYTNGRPEHERSATHSTLYVGDPGTAPPGVLGTARRLAGRLRRG